MGTQDHHATWNAFVKVKCHLSGGLAEEDQDIWGKPLV